MIQKLASVNTIRNILTDVLEDLGNTTHFSDVTSININEHPKRTITLELLLFEPVSVPEKCIAIVKRQDDSIVTYIPRSTKL